MNELKGKVVIITGGSTGIGLAIVKRLLNRDVKLVALFELDNPNSRKVVEDLKKLHGGKIKLYPCDVTNLFLLESQFERVFQEYKTIDILINNAGIGAEIYPERMIDINYKAVVLASLMMISRVGKHRNGKGGTIVNIASVLGLENVKYPIYCSTKRAVISFTRTMEEHIDTTGVRVVAICPNVTDTRIMEDSSRHLDFIDETDIERLKLQSPDNVAAAVIQIIEQGQCGDVWISENDEPPYEIKDHERPKNLFHFKSNL